MAKKNSKEEKLVVENKEEKVVLDTKESVKFKFQNAPFNPDGKIEEITAELANLFTKQGYGKVYYE